MQFFQDHYTVSMEADAEASDELGNDLNQMNNDQLALADGPIGNAIKNFKNYRESKAAEKAAQDAAEQVLKKAMSDIVGSRIPTYTYDQAMAVNDVGKLQTIADAYQRVHDTYQSDSERLQARAGSILNRPN